MTATDCDLLVCGDGASAPLIALLLHQQGLRVALAPTSQRAFATEDESDELPSRTLALSRRSVAVLEQLSVWPQLLPEATAVQGMRVWDAASGGLSRFARPAEDGSPLAWVVAADALQHLLWRQAEVEDVAVLPAGEVVSLDADSRQVTASFKGRKKRAVRADLLVAADGGTSPLRHLAGIASDEYDTGQTAIAALVRTTTAHDNRALQAFTAAPGPLALLPFAPLAQPLSAQRQSPAAKRHRIIAKRQNITSHWRSLIWSMPSAQAREKMALSEETFAAQCAQACDGAAGDIVKLGPRKSFPIRHRLARHFVSEQYRLALAGDAAQTLHPLAGQGMNLAFGDAAALARVALSAQRRRLPPGDRWALHRYRRRRSAERLPAERAIGGLLQLFAPADAAEPPSKTSRWMRGLGMRAATGVPPLRLILQRIADGQG